MAAKKNQKETIAEPVAPCSRGSSRARGYQQQASVRARKLFRFLQPVAKELEAANAKAGEREPFSWRKVVFGSNLRRATRR